MLLGVVDDDDDEHELVVARREDVGREVLMITNIFELYDPQL